MRRRDDCGDHRAGAGFGSDPRHERAIDLDVFDREPIEARERRLPRAEAIEAEREAQRTELFEHRRDAVSRVDQKTFGDFHLEAVRRDRRSRDDPPDPLDESPLLELSRRYVERHARNVDSGRVPRRELPARLFEHPFADRVDEAGLLGDLEEIDRQTLLASRPLPAQHRFGAGNAAAARVEHRPVPELELVALDRLAKLALEIAARACAATFIRSSK